MKNRKVLVGMMLVASMAFMACGKAEVAQVQSKERVAEAQEAVEQTSDVEDPVEETADQTAEQTEELPAYEYPGPEAFYTTVYSYVVDEFGSQYPDEGVKIPCIQEIYVDESDESDIKVYGDFWVFSYVKNGQTMECVSGGNYPGLMHLAYDGDYKVTGFDVVEDGSGWNASCKKIFGEHYEEFMKLTEDSNNLKNTRAQILANYVFDKGLDITEYKDYGWDPVPLPEQNIDSFYSDLD